MALPLLKDDQPNKVGVRPSRERVVFNTGSAEERERGDHELPDHTLNTGSRGPDG